MDLKVITCTMQKLTITGLKSGNEHAKADDTYNLIFSAKNILSL